jgi:Stigma-specific protein, Stig1
MSSKMNKGLALWVILLGLAFPAACGSSGVVGGECSASYISCDGQCVDAQNDPGNCGGCKRACDDGVECHNAICGGSNEGGAGTSGSGGTSNGDSGAGGDSGSANSSGTAGEEDDAGNLSDANPDGDAACLPPYDRPTACGDCETKCPGNKPVCTSDGMGSFVCVAKCKAPLVECDGQCVDPETFDTADQCGACHNKCPTTAPTCSPDGAGGHKCVLICDPPLTACSGQCVDLNIDPFNCGKCGNVCESGICQGGMCVGANSGHIVAACMDYQTAASGTPQITLLKNALFLSNATTVRILAYTEYAPPSGRAKVDQAIGFASVSPGGSPFKITALDKFGSASAQLSISKYEVFLVYDQSLAPPGQMATVGAAWHANSVLDSFAAAGGTVIVLSGGRSEMDQFLSSSQLLDVSAQTVLTASKLYNRRPNDSVGNGVISPFLAPSSSCTFTTTVADDVTTAFVLTDTQSGVLGSPAVVHRSISPP